MKLFEKPKFDRCVIETDDFLIQIGTNGIFITKICGSGDEKDCDYEITWDEIYELRKGYTIK